MVFYSYLARFRNTVTLNMNMFRFNTGFAGRNTVFIFCLWLRCVPGICEYLFLFNM